jgi:hypothetical protein
VPTDDDHLTEPLLGDPLEPMSDEDITRHARDVVTNVSMLGDVRDRDWNASLMLIICGWDPMPPNASTLFVVPMAPHQGGRWLNGRVPGVTMQATCVPMESAEALVAKVAEFHRMLHPEAPDHGVSS